jgi:Uma2 family endonuclease
MSVPSVSSLPQARTWNKKEYYQLGELGYFRGQRVELIEGQIMVLSPQKPQHWSTVERVRARLAVLFEPGFVVRRQGPLDLGATTEPEPDIAVVSGSLADFAQTHPSTAVLLVEVSDTTLSYDRGSKGSRYAQAGIADYWIVNLNAGQVEIYRDPIADPSQPHGHRYCSRTDLVAPATVAPLALPPTRVAVADLLP